MGFVWVFFSGCIRQTPHTVLVVVFTDYSSFLREAVFRFDTALFRDAPISSTTFYKTP